MGTEIYLFLDWKSKIYSVGLNPRKGIKNMEMAGM